MDEMKDRIIELERQVVELNRAINTLTNIANDDAADIDNATEARSHIRVKVWWPGESSTTPWLGLDMRQDYKQTSKEDSASTNYQLHVCVARLCSCRRVLKEVDAVAGTNYVRAKRSEGIKYKCKIIAIKTP